jgi:hypothetical protein
MTEKKRTTVWIDPHVLRKLKIMGAVHGQPIGNMIEALVAFTEHGQYIKDPMFQKRFAQLLEMAITHAGGRAAIEGSPPEAYFDAGQGPNGDDLEEG